mmetsp:Transcript_70334/g.186936  ORF Transcript_70334/g.186936 Transcript_70334/m.186936 type:complete len:452 (+) Transcript_70334:1445-2800(+)
MGQDNLCVGLGAQRARLQQGLCKPDAAGVDIQARLDVVQGIDHAVQGIPEDIVKGVLGVVTYANLHGLNLEGAVHRQGRLGCTRGLGLANVRLPEEELAVQVGHLNAVHVGDCELALRPAASSHHRKALEELAAQSSSTHHEQLHVAECLLEGLAMDGDLVVVAAADGSPVTGVLGRDQLEHVDVEALVEGRVLAGELHDLLCNNAAKEGGDWANHAPAEDRRILHNVLVDLLDRKRLLGSLCFPRLVDVLGQLHAGGGRRRVADGGQAAVLLPVAPQRLHREVELLRAAELRKVGHREVLATLGLRLHQAAPQGGELDRVGDLDLGHDALPDIRGVSGRVPDSEGVRAGDLDLPGLPVVQLAHALHFPEDDPVIILEAVPPLVVRVHGARCLLGDARDDGAPRLLAVLVAAAEAVAVVDKHSAGESEAVCGDEANGRRVRPAELVPPQKL